MCSFLWVANGIVACNFKNSIQADIQKIVAHTSGLRNKSLHYFFFFFAFRCWRILCFSFEIGHSCIILRLTLCTKTIGFANRNVNVYDFQSEIDLTWSVNKRGCVWLIYTCTFNHRPSENINLLVPWYRLPDQHTWFMNLDSLRTTLSQISAEDICFSFHLSTIISCGGAGFFDIIY